MPTFTEEYQATKEARKSLIRLLTGDTSSTRTKLIEVLRLEIESLERKKSNDNLADDEKFFARFGEPRKKDDPVESAGARIAKSFLVGPD